MDGGLRCERSDPARGSDPGEGSDPGRGVDLGEGSDPRRSSRERRKIGGDRQGLPRRWAFATSRRTASSEKAASSPARLSARSTSRLRGSSRTRRSASSARCCRGSGPATSRFGSCTRVSEESDLRITDLSALEALAADGVQIRYSRRLHAKLVIAEVRQEIAASVAAAPDMYCVGKEEPRIVVAGTGEPADLSGPGVHVLDLRETETFAVRSKKCAILVERVRRREADARRAADAARGRRGAQLRARADDGVHGGGGAARLAARPDQRGGRGPQVRRDDGGHAGALRRAAVCSAVDVRPRARASYRAGKRWRRRWRR